MALRCDESRQYHHADCPNSNVHCNKHKSLGPSPAKPMQHRKGDIRAKRNEQGFPSETAVFAYWLQTIAAHGEKYENCTGAKKHRIEDRSLCCQRQKSGIWIHDGDTESRMSRTAATEAATVSGPAQRTRPNVICAGSSIVLHTRKKFEIRTAPEVRHRRIQAPRSSRA